MAREYLGRALLVTGQPERAVEVLRVGSTMTGHDPAIDVDLVEALIRSGRLDEAEIACRMALGSAPGDPRLGLLYGRLLRRRGALTDALRVLEDTVERTGRRDPVALDALGTTLAAAGRPGEAIRVLEEALALHAGSEADQVLRAHLEAVRRGETPR
jgi:Flp pilus assembly protein TadD